MHSEKVFHRGGTKNLFRLWHRGYSEPLGGMYYILPADETPSDNVLNAPF